MNKMEMPKKREDSVHHIRHSISGYETYKKIRKSENPQGAVDYEDQVTPDLTEKGIELAEKEAEKFLGSLDPEKDALFFVSSSEARALETANIYRQKAKELDFEIIKPENTRSKFAEDIGEGEIRTVKNLSLNMNNVLISSVFNSEKYRGSVDQEKIDEQTMKKWNRACEIIDSSDHGSWGANFFYHSEAIQQIFPEIITAKRTHETKFKNIVRLIKFANKKSKESGLEKSVKVLGFGHENYLGYALNKYFSDHQVGNCEAIDFKVKQGNVFANYREQEKKIE